MYSFYCLVGDICVLADFLEETPLGCGAVTFLQPLRGQGGWTRRHDDVQRRSGGVTADDGGGRPCWSAALATGFGWVLVAPNVIGGAWLLTSSAVTAPLFVASAWLLIAPPGPASLPIS